MKKWLVSTIICIALLVGILPAGVLAVGGAQNDAAPTSAAAAAELFGEGTAEAPYLITSVEDLKAFRDLVNGGKTDVCARLMGDIVFTEDVNWTAIGTAAHPYAGTFDGNNYSIENTSENSPWHMGTETSGLFGYVGESGAIRSLNARLHVDAADDTALLSYDNKGTIEQCSVQAILVNSTAVSEDKVFSNFAHTNSGTIKNCLSILMGNYQNACGFAAVNSGTIENSLCHITYKNGDITSVYAITKDTAGGTVANCYCICQEPHIDFVKSTGEVTPESIYKLAAYDDNRAAYMKKLAWKLNNNGSAEGGNTDPWRYGTNNSGKALNYPTLNPTDQKVTESDGSETVTPHTHRVDGVLREFAALEKTLVTTETSGCYYLPSGENIVTDWEVPANMTLCLNGNPIEVTSGSVVVPGGKAFTVTDCQETAGKITSDTTGVTVSGGTFVLDSVSITGCATGIDYQSGTVKLSGSARVTGNTANIRLAEGQKLTFGLLDETAHFGVTCDGAIAEGGEVEITDRTGAAYAAQISSDNDMHVTGLNNDASAVVLRHPAAHRHCVCGANHKEISHTNDDGSKTGHTAEETVVFRPWNPNSHRDSENRPTLPTAAGSYYLTEDADLKDGTWEPSGEVKLCLNGHTVTFDYRKAQDRHGFIVALLDEAGDDLAVTDCGTTGTITIRGGRDDFIRLTNGAALSLYAGTIKGFARAVCIGNDGSQYAAAGSFRMYGGTLTENSYNVGSAVYANGSDAAVTMYGGTVTNNTTSGSKTQERAGGGVCVQGGGSFTMYGGEISNNGTADANAEADKQNGAAFGGGVYVSGSFTMTGGKISGNTVTPNYASITQAGTVYPKLADAYGGGVYVDGAFRMTGGEITDNSLTKGYGGGVYISGSSTSEALIENATISGNTVSASKDYSYGSEPLNSDKTRYYYGGLGGGIYSLQKLTLKNSKIENNSLTNPIGDNNKYGGGAGVFTPYSDLEIEGCTIRGNTLKGRNTQTDSETQDPLGAIGGAGVCVPGSNLTIKDSTITGNTAISDAEAADGQKLVSGGVLFCDASKTLTVSGRVNITGNTVDGVEGNVYLEKRWNGSEAQKQQTTIRADALDDASTIGVMARTAPTDSAAVTVATSESEIPAGVFTSDKDEYKAALSDDGKFVTLTVNNDMAEVTHNGTTIGYDSLSGALAAAKNGATVKVLKDCTLSQAADIKGITLELNGKTVTATAAITLTEPVTIQNGTISGTVSGEEALIQCQGGSLILKDVEIKESAAEQAVVIVRGSLSMSSGTINGGLKIGAQARVELSGGTFKNANGPAITSMAVGQLASYLKSGYAYQMDDQLVDPSKATSTESGKTITVVPCTHGFDGTSAKCKYCGYVCKHESVDTSDKCSVCGVQMAARVMDFDETNAKWYVTLEEAFASVEKGQEKKVVLLTESNYTANDDIELKGSVHYYPKMNQVRLLFAEGKSLVVQDGGFLVSGGGYIGSVTVKDGGNLGVQAGGAVGTLMLEDDCALFSSNPLQSGKFEKIVVPAGKTVASILLTTPTSAYTFRHTDNTWATDAELAGTTIENVTVVKKPFYDEKITVSPSGELTYQKALNVTLTASKTDSDNYGETTYEWFAAHSPDTVIHTSSAYTTTLTAAGDYEFGCRITRDGYTRTVTQTIKVEQATPSYTAEPEAVMALTYDGTEQALVTGGATSDGRVLYSLDGQNWSEEIPKAKDANRYTVYYKIKGDGNHTDSGVGNVGVQIVPLSVEIEWSGTENLVYDGTVKTITPSISNAVRGDDVTIGAIGNSQTNADSYRAQATNLGGTDAGNYTLDGGKNIEIAWIIDKADASCTAPLPRTLTYNGEDQTLVEAGSTAGGTMQYSLDGTGWSPEIPQAKTAGDYTVYYKVVGDGNHKDTAAASVRVKIEKLAVAIPAEDTNEYTYNGEEQTYTIAANDAYTIEGSRQTNANESGYTVTVKLKDPDNTAWSDGTIADRTYRFIIRKAAAAVSVRDQYAYVGETAPTLGEDSYEVSGLFGNDTLTPKPTVRYVDEDGNEITPDMSRPGETIIRADGAKNANYTISYRDGKLTVSSISSDPVYPITVAGKTEHGSVTVSRRSAGKGATVTVTVAPDKGYILESITVTDKNGRELTLTRKSDSHYTFTMPASGVEVKAAFMEDNAMLNFFVDVKADDYFYDAVLWAAKNGITNGTDETHFSPNAPCTRAQIVTFLWRAAGSPVVNYAMNMTDVPEDAYYAEAVRWALSEGITVGTTATTFSPDAVCTREQAVTFLYRASDSPAVSGGSAFSDVAENAYYADAVAWAERNDITGGIGGGLFGSGSDCTRAQIVTFLYRSSQAK